MVSIRSYLMKISTATRAAANTATTSTTTAMGMLISDTFKVDTGCDGASVASAGT